MNNMNKGNSSVIDRNTVTISGQIASGFKFSHTQLGEAFYEVTVDSMRTSGTIDSIPVIVSERLTDVSQDMTGKYVTVTGSFRSYDRYDSSVKRTRLILHVFATDFNTMDKTYDGPDKNMITIEGYTCKAISTRDTPAGRQVADILLASNRTCNRADHIPCIVWGRNALFSTNFEIGTRVLIKGRIQSRQYIKKHDDDTEEERTAYELSVQSIEAIEKPVLKEQTA